MVIGSTANTGDHLESSKVAHNEHSQNVDDYAPLYVILFAPKVVQCTIHWFVDLLQKKQSENGAELLVKMYTTDNGQTLLLISGKPLRLLGAAEMMEINKEDKSGIVREFSLSALDLFLKPGINIHNLLSTSEKQRIILNEIMSLHSMDKEELFGYPRIKLYPGQSIVQVFKDNGIIEQIFPLHQQSELSQIESKWFLFPFIPPIDDMRNYFGEAIGFYFAFLVYYTFALIPPTVVGILQSCITLDTAGSYVFLAIFKMIWVTLFLESWKRRSNELAFSWGTLKTVALPKLHPSFRGKALEIDPVTKQHIPVYPSYKRHFKVYCISTPVIALCAAFSIFVTLIYFQIESYIIEEYQDHKESWILVQLPGVIYSIIIFIMSCLYAKLANCLTEWENHKTQISFENNRIVKLLVFEFVNNFAALGYIAFYLRDMDMLRMQICIMLIVNQLLNQLQETVLPILFPKFKEKLKKKQSISSTEKKLHQVVAESEMWPYEGTYDDYLEMFIQFGYVFLFSSVYPHAALYALINNACELFSDAIKLCHGYQRPQAQPAKGIGVWQIAFEVLGVLSVITNCALISMSPEVQLIIPDASTCTWLLIAVCVEHIIIAVKMTLAYLISDVPKWVTVEIQKAQYESLQALKAEKKQKIKEVLMHMEKKSL